MLLPFEEIPEIDIRDEVSEIVDVFNTIVSENKLEDKFEFIEDKGIMVLNVFKNELEPTQIRFPRAMFSNDVIYPTFVFATGHISKTIPQQKINYWELLYWILYARLKTVGAYEVTYSGLISQDIKMVNNFVSYNQSNSYNAQVKERNTVVLLNVYDGSVAYHSQGRLRYRIRDDVPGNWLFSENFREEDLHSIIGQLNITASSETILSSGNKVIMYNPKDKFLAPGFMENLGANGEVESFTSIFPPKQNIPSRWKTHIHGNSFSYINPDEAIFVQDLKEDIFGNMSTKDSSLRNMIVMFEEIDEDTYRFAAGEIEVSQSFSSQIVIAQKHKEIQLDELDTRIVKGAKISSSGGRIKIGVHDGEDRFIDLVDYINVIDVNKTGIGETYRIDYISSHRSANCRITSNTGLKGVTKAVVDTGVASYGSEKIYLDGACSINSLKAKMNTIILAKAALAFKLGFYLPKNGTHLDSFDVEEISTAAKSLPEFTVVKNGKVYKNAQIGLIQASVTELGSTYARLKPQVLPFNAVKYLYQGENTALADYIMDNHINERSKDIVFELKKVIEDKTGVLADEGEYKLPVYDLDKIAKIFKPEDCILSAHSYEPSLSKLLDEEFNKGFYIHCKPVGMEKIRIPPAKILNALCGQLQNGEYSYPDIVINISKIILHCINGNKHFVTHYTQEENKSRITAKQAYLKRCNSMLFSEEAFGQRMVKTLLNPELYGIGLKQVFDQYVPDDVIVIPSNFIFKQFVNKIWPKEEYPDLNFADVEINAFAVRNPFLWKTMLTKVKIWNIDRFALHLKDVHSIELESYLSTQYNRFCVLVGKSIIMAHHSDCDGDLLSISIPNGIEGQNLIDEFQLHGVSDAMKLWDESYLEKEMSSNEDIDWNAEYELYEIPAKRIKRNFDNYQDYLINASIAKSGIGSATNSLWVMYMILQLYYRMQKDGRPEVIPPDERIKAAVLDDEMIDNIDYTYIRLVEEGVINAIKHVKNGSMGFQKYYLASIANPQSNQKEILKELTDKFEMSASNARALIHVVMWAGRTGYLEACQKFIQMHNKGLVCTDDEILDKFPDIIKYTFVGSTFEDFYNVKRQIVEAREQKRAKLATVSKPIQTSNVSTFGGFNFG